MRSPVPDSLMEALDAVAQDVPQLASAHPDRLAAVTCTAQVPSAVSTCWTYDAAGDWATRVGAPARSGVAGGLIGALPGQVGIATSSPRLGVHGTSVRGSALLGRSSSGMGMHVMEVPLTARGVVRSNHVVGTGEAATRVLLLQGGVRFAGAEKVVRDVLLEVVRRLTSDGHAVSLVDPEGVLPDPHPGDGGRVVAVLALDTGR